jgi:hypothetical protein
MSEAERELQEPQIDEPVERPDQGEPPDIEREESNENPSRNPRGRREDEGSDDEDLEDSELPIPGMEAEPDDQESETEVKGH